MCIASEVTFKIHCVTVSKLKKYISNKYGVWIFLWTAALLGYIGSVFLSYIRAIVYRPQCLQNSCLYIILKFSTLWFAGNIFPIATILRLISLCVGTNNNPAPITTLQLSCIVYSGLLQFHHASCLSNMLASKLCLSMWLIQRFFLHCIYITFIYILLYFLIRRRISTFSCH